MTGKPEIIVHHLEQAIAVLQVADDLMIDLQLRSAPGAATFAGVGYLHALGEATGHELLIDCQEDAGLVMAALRTGCRRLAYNGPAETHQRLVDMASQYGASLSDTKKITSPCLALSRDDQGKALRDRVAAFAESKRDIVVVHSSKTPGATLEPVREVIE